MSVNCCKRTVVCVTVDDNSFSVFGVVTEILPAILLVLETPIKCVTLFLRCIGNIIPGK